MPRGQEHGVSLPRGLLDALHDLAIAEQPLGERRPNELRAINGATLLA